MKRQIINTKEATIETLIEALSHYHFGWCNVINKEMLERMRRQSNLELFYPNDNKAFEYHYFFDIRDTNDPDYRPGGQTKAERLQFVEVQLIDICATLRGILREIEYNDAIGEDAYFKLEDKITAMCDKLEKVGEQSYDLSLEIDKK